MDREVGWAEPDAVVSPPRLQMVDGFYYLHVARPQVREEEVGDYMGRLARRLFDACRQRWGEGEFPPLVSMFLDPSGQPGLYDLQMGFALRPDPGVDAVGEARVRWVDPALCASILVWGGGEAVVQSYGPLMQFISERQLRGVEGWREWYYCYESDASLNNITLVQHLVEAA